ncbi:MAG: BT_3928 family protein [Cyclobacteriaceae bacterium]
MSLIVKISKWLVGLLFIISGYIKLNDPYGTAIKLDEYFVVFADSFAPFFSLLIPAALYLSVFLSTLEIILGFAVLLNFKPKTTAWSLLIIIVFFSFLTFFSAYTGKVTDCGCFGDALPLTPWQSFSKDMILLFFIGILFLFRNKVSYPSNNRNTKLIIGLTFACLWLGVYSIRHLPLIDFRPYKIGNNIKELMNNGKASVYHYKMEKDGVQQVFKKYPSDQSWKYVESVEVVAGEDPTILDFMLFDKEGNDLTNEILTGPKVLFVFNHLGEINNAITKEEIANYKKTLGDKIYLVTSSDLGNSPYKSITNNIVSIDETVSKAMIRSNPGIIALNDGVVKGKWNSNDIPVIGELITELFR